MDPSPERTGFGLVVDALADRGLNVVVTGSSTPRIGLVPSPKIVATRARNEERAEEIRDKRERRVRKESAFNLQTWWRTRFANDHGIAPEDLPSSGRDTGHFRDLVREFGDRARDVLRFALDNWDKIRSRHYRFRDLGYPDIQTIFLIRRELHMIVLTGKWPDPVKPGKGESKKQATEFSDGFNADSHDWDSDKGRDGWE